MSVTRRAALVLGTVPFMVSTLAMIAVFVAFFVTLGGLHPPTVQAYPFFFSLIALAAGLVAGTFRILISRELGDMRFVCYAVIASAVLMGWPAAHYYFRTDPVTVVVTEVGRDDAGRPAISVSRPDGGEAVGRLFGWDLERLAVGDRVRARVDPSGWVDPLDFPALNAWLGYLAVTVLMALVAAVILAIPDVSSWRRARPRRYRPRRSSAPSWPSATPSRRDVGAREGGGEGGG